MIRISTDLTRCQGYGICVSTAPNVFDIDDSGLVVVLEDTVPDEQSSLVTQAALGCPTSAITVTPAVN